MDWMRCVLMNRLLHPTDFDADRHATQIRDIITAHHDDKIQFQGFQNYPIIGSVQTTNIKGIMAAAAGKLGYDQDAYIIFIKTAIAAATDSPPSDPTAMGLYFWVASGAPPPESAAVPYQDSGGNAFYTWNRPPPRKRHVHHIGD